MPNYPGANGAGPSYQWGQAGAMQRPSVYSPGFWQIKPGQDYVAGNQDQLLRNQYIANQNRPAPQPAAPVQQPAYQQSAPQMGHYNIGITDGYLRDEDIAKGISMATRPMTAPQMPNTGAGQGALNTQFQDLLRQNNGAVASEMSRQGAQSQAALNMARQQAMANAGLAQGNLAARVDESNQIAQQPIESFLLRLLMGNA